MDEQSTLAKKALNLMAQLIQEDRNKMDTMIEEIRKLKAQIAVVADPDIFTVAGYASWNKISLDIHQSAKIGRRAAKLCRERGHKINKAGVYPTPVLKETFDMLLFNPHSPFNIGQTVEL